MKKTFSSWLRDLIDVKYNKSVSMFAKTVHLSSATIFCYIRGELTPKESNLVRIIVAAGGHIDNDAYADWKEKREEALWKSGYKSESLCWNCQNAVPGRDRGCSWSRFFIPVEGWNAKGTSIKQKGVNVNGYCSSYRVIECPLFVPDDCTLDFCLENQERWKDTAKAILSEDHDAGLEFGADRQAELKREKELRILRDEQKLKLKRERERERYYASRGRPVPTAQDIAKAKKEREERKKRDAIERKKRRERYIKEIEG